MANLLLLTIKPFNRIKLAKCLTLFYWTIIKIINNQRSIVFLVISLPYKSIPMEVGEEYLKSIHNLFLVYKTLGEKAINQIEAEQLVVTPNEDSNSIAIIVQHLHGNMLSRWTDFLTTDGEKPWRTRDAEFEVVIKTKEDLLKNWEEGWQCVFNALNALTTEDLTKIIYIRNEGHKVVDAINRQLAHYPYHIGQMIYAAKMLKNGGWQSLSIPKNQSKNFNADKFSQEKSEKSFTEEYLKNLK